MITGRLVAVASALALLLSTLGCGSDGDEVAGADADASVGDGAVGDDGDDDGDDGDDGVDPPSALARLGAPRTLVFCAGATAGRYDPVAGQSLDLFPDAYLSVDDATSRTGVRLRVDETTPWLGWLPGGFQQVFRDLSELDGFGVTADLFVRFDGELAPPPTGPKASVQSATLQLYRLAEGEAPLRIPFEATHTDDGATLVVAPMVPLRPKTRHLLVVAGAHGDASGGCLAPAPLTAALLERRVPADLDAATRERLARLALRWEAALDAAGVAAQSVAALTVFTTQSVEDDSLAIAADIRTRDTEIVGLSCSEPAGKAYRLCTGQFAGGDYRVDGRLAGTSPQQTWNHPVRIWLPKGKAGPYPLVIFGHGLTGSVSQGDRLADFAAPVGVASIAIDAVAHGKHPGGGAKGIGAVFQFFGIDAAKLAFDFLELRDNWRQSTYDKLQLVEAIRRHPDLDGDGVADVDLDRIGYLGVSLGGIMGPELLALSPDLRFGVLSVPGGKVTAIIASSTQFAPLIKVFQPEGTTDGDVARFFAVLQTLVDAGDAAAYGPHVLHDRLPGAGSAPPDLLLQMAIGDDIVPNIATRMLVRALGVPIVGDVRQPIGLVEEGLTLPLAGNVGGRTAGVFQFDRLRAKKGAAVEPADHSSTPASFEAMTQDLAFLQSWIESGVATMIDPYEETGTPALAP